MSEEELGDYSFVPFRPQQSRTFQSESQHLNEFKQKVGEAENEKRETKNITEDSASKPVEPVIASDEEENKASFKVDFNKAFNPGFTKFGQFGGQSAASILWGEQKD